jgi:hypothetical protein
MKHLAIYEDFNAIFPTADLFGLTFKLVLKNQTVIKGPIDKEEDFKKLFDDNKQYSLMNMCYPVATQHYLNYYEIERAECAENNIREYLKDKVDLSDCEIKYYRPLFIDSDWSPTIKVYAPGAGWRTDDYLRIKKNYKNKYSKEYYEQLPEMIATIKEFAKKHGVTHVLPHGSVIIRHPLRIENYKYFTPISQFEWEDYLW